MQSPEAKRRKLMDGKDRAEGASREQNPPFYLNQSQMAMLNFLQQQNTQKPAASAPTALTHITAAISGSTTAPTNDEAATNDAGN